MKRSGFTLIEVMLVVIIIGVLAAMVMPRLAGRADQAKISTAKADISANLALALDLYEMDMNMYPEKLEDLRVNPGSDEAWRGPYVKGGLKDPWGREYCYERRSSSEEDYLLCSKGPSPDSSEDDICSGQE